MDRIVETYKYSEDIITLWKKAFGDSREDVIFFLNHAKNKSCLCLYDDDFLCSMFFLVDCKVQNKAFKYVYAACTDREYQTKGCMTRLLNYAKEHYENIILIPADISLASYYLKRGFNHKMKTDNILFNECSEIKDYLFEGCFLEEPFALAYMGD